MMRKQSNQEEKNIKDAGERNKRARMFYFVFSI